MLIRKMLPQDVSDVETLLKSIWPDSSRVRRTVRLELLDMFSDAAYRPTFFVAVTCSGEIVGCGAWNWSWLNYGMYELCWGCLYPAYRGQGLGRKLVEARLADIAEQARNEGETTFQVFTSTHRPEIYKRYGFKTILVTPDGTSIEDKSHLMILDK
jgi:GNAT superfamily N-acetyltransferase